MRRMKKIVIVCMMLLVVMSCVSGESEDYVTPSLMEVGTEAPDFLIKTTDQPDGFLLSSLQGKYVFIEFWASWCPDCRKVTENMKTLYNTYASDKLVFLGVSFDRTEDAWTTYISEQGLDWLQHWEEDGMSASAVSIAYNIKWIPTFYLLDPEGKVVKGSIEISDMESTLEEMAEEF